MAYGASWTNVNPVAIGDATKKDHYDNAFDNGQALMSSLAIEHNNPSGGSQPGVHSIFRQATFNQGDTPAPDIYGMEVVKFAVDMQTPSQTTGAVIIDNSIDYRDKWVKVECMFTGFDSGYTYNNTWKPGGAQDDKIYGGVFAQLTEGMYQASTWKSQVPTIADNDGDPTITIAMGYTASGHSSLVVPSAGSPSFVTRVGIYLTGGPAGAESIGSLLVDNDTGAFCLQQYEAAGNPEDVSGVAVCNGIITVFSKENKI